MNPHTEVAAKLWPKVEPLPIVPIWGPRYPPVVTAGGYVAWYDAHGRYRISGRGITRTNDEVLIELDADETRDLVAIMLGPPQVHPGLVDAIRRSHRWAK